MSVEIHVMDPTKRDSRAMIRESDRLLSSLYPSESNHLESPEELAKPGTQFVGAYLNGVLVGCGAAKTLSDDGVYGEIKRVFVGRFYRGRGISREIMAYLEQGLLNRGVLVSRLETGIKQAEALELYRRLGYRERGPFGRYRQDPLSVFMEKTLQPVPPQTAVCSESTHHSHAAPPAS